MSRSLDVTTPSPTEIRVVRSFDAPARLIFDCHTKPDLVRRWLTGTEGWSMPVCEIDLRVGGAYRYVIRKAGGQEYPFKGVYREIDRPSRLVYTQIYDVAPFNQSEAVVTTVFDERNGRTTMRETSRCESKRVRDGWLQSGMEEGAGKSLDALAELLESLKGRA